MRTDEFDYDLPPDLIAQTPAEPRDSSRLLVLDRDNGTTQHRTFDQLPDLLRPNDVLIINDSRVLPARLRGRRMDTGGTVEATLIRDLGADEWIALVRPGRRVRRGVQITFGDGTLTADVVEQLEDGARRLRFRAADGGVPTAIRHTGVMPLPPYIRIPLANSDRYQTVYALTEGSVAAPTAGLHFTPNLLRRLTDRGVVIRRVTLHVGAGTFKPVRSCDVADHRMHSEWAILDPDTASYVNAARAGGRRVVGVGTTTVRVLETASSGGVLTPFAGWTDMFIKPGYRFCCVDAMVTNFHLPRSTLLMLVSAFAGKALVDRAYAEAIANRYRFYSFGDAMLIV